jgi:small subunit ribosomal protein S20
MIKSRAKTLAKDFVELVDDKKKEEAKKLLAELSSFLDKAVSKGVYHRNTAARKKSRMNHLLSGLKA